MDGRSENGRVKKSVGVRRVKVNKGEDEGGDSDEL